MLLGVYAVDVSEGEAILQPLREIAEPIVDHSGVVPFAAYQIKLDPMVPDHVRVYGTSLYFDQLTDETIEQILNKIDNACLPQVFLYSFGHWVEK